MDERASAKIREQALIIAQSKDFDLLLAELRGDKSDAMLISASEEIQPQTPSNKGSEFMTPLEEVSS